MCRTFPVQEAKWKIFPAELGHVQDEYEEALNSSCTCQDFAITPGTV
jgi:hypothetical protein